MRKWGDVAKLSDLKCIVWDLDNTIWHGILLETDKVRLVQGIEEVLSKLDSRGILHSIASRNNYDDAMDKLKQFNIAHYFLYPEISWEAKSQSISRIQKKLNISMDSILLIDDQPFERDEVKSMHPEVTCWDAGEFRKLLSYNRLKPRFITEDSKRRRLMYIEDMNRRAEEENWQLPKEQFLASLNMKFNISIARAEDLKRAEELTIRTNQLNATGRTYDYEELKEFRESHNHILLICELTDRYGSYGKVGLGLVELGDSTWTIKLLLMSCRVMSRGLGTVFLNYIMCQAQKKGKTLRADFRHTGKNKMMYVAFRFANFKELKSEREENIVFENDLSQMLYVPPYILVIAPEL